MQNLKKSMKINTDYGKLRKIKVSSLPTRFYSMENDNSST